jgi:hypothetical protein
LEREREDFREREGERAPNLKAKKVGRREK